MNNDSCIVFEHLHVKFESNYSYRTNTINFRIFNDSHRYESNKHEVIKKKIINCYKNRTLDE